MFMKDQTEIQKENEDIFSIFTEQFCSTSFSNYVHVINQKQYNNQNHLLSLLNSFILTVTHFCKMNYHYLSKYKNSHHLFLDTFIKKVNTSYLILV
jgi:hypothetical protein